MSSDTIKMKGFVNIRLEDSKTGDIVSDSKHNFVSNALKNVALAQSLSYDLCPNVGSLYGLVHCFKNNAYTYYTGSGSWLKYNKIPDATCLALLRLDDSVEMDSNTKYLPILSNTGDIDYTKVTGYSVGRLLSTNEKEGVINVTGATQMVNIKNVAISHLFDTDIATGEFNWLAILPGFETHPWHSFQTFKCISNYNVRQSGDTNRWGYVRPGVTDGTNVLTGDNEILLFFTHKGVSKWKYNLATGEMRAVGISELAYNFENSAIVNYQSCGNQIVVNGFLYAIAGNALYKINITDGQNVTYASIAYNEAYGEGHYGLWYDGNSIWVSSYTTNESNTTRAYFKEIDPNSMSVKSTIYNNDYTGWGNLPAKWNKTQTCMNKVNDVYYVFNYKYGATIMCTDIMDVCGSIIGIMGEQGTALFNANNQTYHWRQGYVPSIYLGTETSEGDASTNYPSFWISDETCSNFWSAVKLDEVKDKGASIKAYIDYGYEFE